MQTQLQILTAVVKLFLKKPDQSQGLVQKVLQSATAECDNPDVRDRAYVYWRLLSSDPQITKVSFDHPLREWMYILIPCRTSSFRISLQSPRPFRPYPPHSSTRLFKSSRRWRRFTTSSRSLSLAKVASAQKPCKRLPSSMSASSNRRLFRH